MAVESLSDEINRLRTRIKMFEDKISSQSVEENTALPALSMNCSRDETANSESNDVFGCRVWQLATPFTSDPRDNRSRGQVQ
jgi:hypothetical protein